MNFTVNVFKNAVGRKLSSIEAHDVVCKIEVVVVGGVRRSALISLSNLSDDRMRAAKSGQWWNDNPQRALANNSACYSEKPDIGVFMDEWKSLYDSKSGERGIFNRESAVWMASKNGRRNTEDYELAQTHVQRLFYAIVSSVIYQRLWFVHLIHGSLFWRK